MDDTSSNDSLNNDLSNRIAELKTKVDAEPLNYRIQVDYIECLRKTDDYILTRQARDNMLSKFPFNEDMWIEYLDDELDLFYNGTVDISEIVKIFERSTKDYISVNLWLKYCQFLIDNIKLSSDFPQIRHVFEKAINECGIHVTEAISIWESYIEFETGILESYKQQYLTSGTQTVDQSKLVLLIYKRLCTVPLIGLEKNIDQFKLFVKTFFNQDYEKYINDNLLKNTLKKLSQCLVYEEQLASVDSSNQVNLIKEYVQYEIKSNEPTRACCLFERAIKLLPLSEELWHLYLNFLEKQNIPENIRLIVHEKAIRNMPWIIDFRIAYMENMELYSADFNKIYNCFMDSINWASESVEDLVDLCIAWISYKRRTTINQDENCFRYLVEIIDWCIQLVQSRSKQLKSIIPLFKYKCLLLFRTNKISESIEIWMKVLNQIKFDEKIWEDFIEQLEKYGSYENLRQIYQRICQLPLDNPDRLYEKFLHLEIIDGNLCTYREAKTKVLEAKQKHSERLIKRKRSFNGDTKDFHDRSNKQSKKFKQSNENPSNTVEKQNNRIFEHNSTETDILTSGFSNGNSMDISDETNVLESFNDIQVSSGKKSKHYNEKNTVFLSNLSFNIDEKQIRDCLEKCGIIKEVRMVEKKSMYNKNKCKGFAYVEFFDEECVNNALIKDRSLIDGRPVYISKCMEKHNRKPAHKSSEGIDRKTLYITGLPYQMTKDQLNDILKDNENLKEIRLVTNKSGRSKGFAYVEFIDEASAAKAILSIDEYQLEDGHKLSAAISNASLKKKITERPFNFFKNTTINETVNYNSTSSIKPSMTPRSLIKQKLQNQSLQTNISSNSDSKIMPKSNEEFRKLFGIM